MINHDPKSLNECNPKGPDIRALNADPAAGYCHYNDDPSKRKVDSSGWLEDVGTKKVGLGAHNLCDPMQTGQIVNDVNNPQRNVIYRYSKSIRGTHEAVKDLFTNIIVQDEDGKIYPVPIIYGRQERAVAAILQDNVRKDTSLVVDRIRLPMMSIWGSDYTFNQSRYTYHRAKDFMPREDGKPGFTIREKYDRDTIFGRARGIPIDIGYNLYVWTAYIEDMDQIMEQILPKFSPKAYIKVRGVHWETQVSLDSIANNIDVEPGDKTPGIIKFQFNLTAETYISQPLYREKAVLKTVTDYYNDVNEQNIDLNYARLEEAVKEFEND